MLEGNKYYAEEFWGNFDQNGRVGKHCTCLLSQSHQNYRKPSLKITNLSLAEHKSYS